MCDYNKLPFDELVDVTSEPSCWRCGSNDYSAGETECHGDYLNQDVECNDCYSTWQLVYEIKQVYVPQQ
ncbi:hypothetical protein [Vibrio diabolicus]|uniref:hypothetical protein n=1 Tax=Vibrio diabolicus TaxID=50719 RepID=UPI00375170E5|nr:hypothetical protein [Vibrio parahaemolyticus]HCG6550224.1 hypothetical protein [Vibrio parahaemolyticus]HCG6982097.1 hypothetical protein [Vibrio parahaemolyticus]